MNRSLDSKLGRLINVAAMVTLIASVLTIYFFVGSLNRNAARTDRVLLSAAIDAAASQNDAWATDYGWWNETRRRVETNDVELMSQAMGSSFSDHSGFDFIAAASGLNEQVHAWHRDSGTQARTDLIALADIQELRSDLFAAHARGEYLTSHFMTIAGRPYLVSATVIGEFEDRSVTSPASDPLLIVGTRIGTTFMAEIEERFLLENVRFHAASATMPPDAMALVDAGGHRAGYLSFSPSQPGIDMLRLSLLPLIGYIVAVFLAAQLIIRKARTLARRAERNERKAVEAAGTDSLSGLPNRQGFTAYIGNERAEAAAADGEAAIVYIDLNGFKAVNDKVGHRAGDRVIREVARRFREAIGDDIHIARIGGDEFACALVGQQQAADALRIARSLSASLEPRFDLDGRLFEIGAAIGIAWSRRSAVKTFSQLVHDADLAMYRAKADQLSEPLCFDASLGLEHAERQKLEADIEAGLQRQEFHVVYQPIARARDGSIASVEALLRWEHPTRGAVPPDVFIPVAEGSKLIRILGDFVLETVCREIGPEAGFTVSINLSPTQLNDQDLCHRYCTVLDRHGMTPSAIELELTEAVLVEDFDRAQTRLLELHDAGFGVNLDDFGTGFAGMGYLHLLPFNKIKVDKSFVATIGRGDNRNKMLQALSLLGDALNLDMVAEGVETESQAAMLRLLGFEYLQGWYFGHPMRVDALKLRLRNAA